MPKAAAHPLLPAAASRGSAPAIRRPRAPLAGFTVSVALPAIAIEAPLDPGPLHDALLHVERYDWVVVTSPFGAHELLRRVRVVFTADSAALKRRMGVMPETLGLFDPLYAHEFLAFVGRSAPP